MNKESNIKRFEELMAKVNRDGKDALMEYIKKSDFYTAPASTKYHLSVTGGLLQHSLNVYDCLEAKKDNKTWAPILAEAGEESLIIISLLHDLCKTYFYTTGTKNQKTYDPEKVAAADRYQVKHDNGGDFIWETVEVFEVNDQVPYGHGEKSVMMIERFMPLKGFERFAIRWHMGYSEPPQLYQQLGQAMERYPIILALHEADAESSNLIEGKEGNRQQDPAPDNYPEEKEGCDFQEAEPVKQEG